MSAKDIKPHVRGELLLSKELLSRSEYRAQPGNDERVAHDIFIADDAAEMALGAICSQLGYPGCKHRVSVTDYFNWLLRSGKARLPVPGMEFFTGLHKARIDLQAHFVVPDLYKWHRVTETTLGFITRWCQEYLNLQVWNLQWNLAGDRPSQTYDAAHEPTAYPSTGPPIETDAENLADDAENRRFSPRYDCEGSAEIHIPSTGRVIRGHIANLSLCGCYIETSAVLDVGTRVEIVLRVTGLAFRAVGEVRSTYGSAGIGVKFTGMSAGGHARLRELIANLEEAWFAAGMPGNQEES